MMVAVADLVVEGEARLSSVPLVDALRRTVLRVVLISSVGSEHVRRAHAADAPMMTVLRWAGRVIGRQIVERRRNAGGVEVVPEWHALPLKVRGRRLVVERPEIELEAMIVHIPVAFAGNDRGGRVDGHALLVRIAVNEIEDAVGTGTGAVDEVGPGDGALRRDARPQGAEAALLAELGEVGQLRPALLVGGVHHVFGQARVHAVDADDDDFLADAFRRAIPAAEPVAAGADTGSSGGSGGDGDGRAFQEGPAIGFAGSGISHHETGVKTFIRLRDR